MARTFPGGVNYLNVGDVAAVDITGTALTLAMWLYSANGVQFPFSKAGTQFQAFQWTDWDWRFEVGDGASPDQLRGGQTPQNAWAHLAMVKAGNTFRTLINGAQVASGTSNKSIANTGNALLIGRGVDGNQFGGRLAEVALWNVSLTNEEIAALAKGVSPAMVRLMNLRGYWPLFGLTTPEANLAPAGPANAALVGALGVIEHPRGGPIATSSGG